MAVWPLNVRDDGTVAVWHDEAGHGGDVALSDLAFGHRLAGLDLVEDRNFIVLPCPVPGCDSASLHPASGGCAPEEVQRLFAAVYLAHPDVPAETAAEAHDLARAASDALDGPDRWQLGDAPGGE